ncbi:hypothetical protein T265_08782 [Opisthorchis viverrini]|uniref:Uncharacterized protein n=1 Tax=Opisthorchis viverrini TaxID=6198 RepID=A0A074ZCH0_OPIVI|nr:hypothetical protein T265_08782 [Opisthorchis viverrini]KER23297.1 hypothetical protein T265_08782 [Opisthorchis viverrini]
MPSCYSKRKAYLARVHEVTTEVRRRLLQITATAKAGGDSQPYHPAKCSDAEPYISTNKKPEITTADNVT